MPTNIEELAARLEAARKDYAKAERAVNLAYNLYKKAVLDAQPDTLEAMLVTYIGENSIENSKGYKALQERFPWKADNKAYVVFFGQFHPSSNQWNLSLMIEHDASEADLQRCAKEIEDLLPAIKPWGPKDTRTDWDTPKNMIGCKVFRGVNLDRMLVQEPDGTWGVQYGAYLQTFKTLAEALGNMRQSRDEDEDDDN